MGSDNPYKFAVIEDIPTQNDTLVEFLKRMWPTCKVDPFFSFEPALEAIRSNDYDVVVSDVNLGGGADTYAGIKIAKALDSRRTPLIIVSALAEPALHSDIFMALGAWDYLEKPIRESEFQKQLELAIAYRCGHLERERLEAQNRGGQRDPDLQMDLGARAQVVWRNRRVHLSLTQIRIVEILTRTLNEPVKYQDLFGVIDTGRNRENLRVHIASIREAFRSVDTSFDRIVSVTMYGYVWRV